MPRRVAIAAFLFVSAFPAAAMVGGAQAVDAAAPRHEVMILSGRGNLCTGVVLVPDLVLTAGHCIDPALPYRLYELDAARQPRFREIAKIAVHPQFSRATFDANRATADVALLKLAAPLPESYAPAALAPKRPRVALGEHFLVAGYGVTKPRDNGTAAVLRRADLVATGQPGNLQLRLVDPATQGEKPGLGACTGDSGGPAYELTNGKSLLYGVISWTTAPRLESGCGGLTGVTPLELYLGWILRTAKSLGSPLGP
ncbi:MAG TPA: trypsin-like serine protease [Xanthobacteraceae bacterium]|nr:trypsin-like serine protease [Xanthobacteraceae bacterium]